MSGMIELSDARLIRAEQPIFSGLNFALDHQDRVAILGPSGVGKSSLLAVLAGQLSLTSGEFRQTAQQVVLMQQRPALLPWLSTWENIALGARLAGIAPKRDHIAALISQIGLEGAEHKKPHTLSGGQQQRVALARALALTPDVLLLDEPFSALDAQVRSKLRKDILALQQQSGFALALVTHDPADASALCQRHLHMTPNGLFDRSLQSAA